MKNGEKFVLPNDAVLIGASDINAFESTCDVPELEDVQCYVSIVSVAAEDGNQSQFYEQGKISMIGYRFNNVYTAFSQSYSTYDPGFFNNMSALINEIKNIPGVIDVVHGFQSDYYRGTKHYIVIKTIASIADNLELVANTAPAGTGFNSNTEVRWGFRERDVVEGEGHESIPACPTTSS
jgi:hypothetical protein